MKSLHTVHALPHHYGCDTGMAGIDLFLPCGGFLSLQTDAQELRQILRSTHCNLVRLVTPDSERLAMVGGWPHPWHAFRISLHQVDAEEYVRVHSRVSLGSTPTRVTDGGWSLVMDAPWIQVYGDAESVGALISAEFSNPSAEVLCAADVPLPAGVYLASPRRQVLFRLEKVSGVAAEAALV